MTGDLGWSYGVLSATARQQDSTSPPDEASSVIRLIVDATSTLGVETR